MSIRWIAGLTPLPLLVLAVLAFSLLAGKAGPAEAYSASYTAKFCNALAADFPSSMPFTDADLAGNPACTDTPIPASTARNLTTQIGLSGSEDYLVSPLIQNHAGTTSSDAAIPDGQKVGGIRWEQTLGLLNSACTTLLLAEFILYESSTTGSLPVDPDGTYDGFTPARFNSLVTDADLNEIADSSSSFVGAMPDIYLPLLAPAGGSTITPKARYSGATRVPAGGPWAIASVFVFDAGSLDAFATNMDDLPNPLGRISHSPTNGTITLTLVQSPYESEYPSPVHDFCGDASIQTMLLGTTPGAHTRYTSPASGTTGVSAFTMSRRDADGDGLDNDLDTCPFIADSPVPDLDGDGIANACDPTPGNTGAGDHDGDGVQNKQDDCPLIANPAPQIDGELSETYTDAAPDGGPNRDWIGDACDPNPLTADTEGGFDSEYNVVARCVGATDGDGDGYCSTQDVDDGNAGVGGFSTNPGMDQDFTLLTGSSAKQGDGFGGNTEQYLGTDPLRNCAATSAANDEVVDANPADFDDDGEVDIADVSMLLTHFGGGVPAVPARYDLVPSKSINISDVLVMKPAISAPQCSSGSTAAFADGPVPSVEIDVDTTGNDARLTLAPPIEICITAPGTTHYVDIVMPSPGVLAADGLAGFEFVLNFDFSDVEVLDTDTASSLTLLDAAAGSTALNMGDLTDLSGRHEVKAIDVSGNSPEPGGVNEIGPGVLARIHLYIHGTTQADLTLSNVRLYSSDGELMQVDTIGNAAVAYNQACTPIPAGDADADGIEDSTDTDPLTPSAEFSDEHGPGAMTTGSVVDDAGNTVTITDADDGATEPSERGVRVVVSGAGGTTVIEFCGEELELTPGDDVILTCGSAWVVVQAGTAVLRMGTYKGLMDAVTAVRFQRLSPGEYKAFNHPFSQHDAVIGGLSIAPNTEETVKDTDGDGRVDLADNCPSIANPTQANLVHPGTSLGDHCEDPDIDDIPDASDNCPDAANNGQENGDGDPRGDACDPCPSYPSFWNVPAGDSDCDGFTSTAETSMGTDITKPCGFTAGAPAQSETWPPDLVETNSINISDVLALKPVFGTAVPPTSARFDLVPGAGINISDVLALKPVFGASCTP